MGCCGVRYDDECAAPGSAAIWVRQNDEGENELNLVVPGIHCAACISTIEKGLKELPGLKDARVNFSLKQVRARWTDPEFDPESIVSKLDELGYAARPFDPSDAGFGVDDRESRELLRALAVAGFAAGNIMFLSISVWAGAEGATRDFFHWVSALLALPAIAYAGRPFFRSAWNALSRARMNMDVPISLAVLTAAMMSLYQVANHQQHAYFDAAVSLLFFLLIGRYLDHRMRARARSAVSQLMTLAATGATVLDEEGRKRFLPMDALQDGMRVLVAAGERIPVDGIVEEGETDVDVSLITGESNPERVGPGARVYAGAMNLTGPIVVRLTAHGEDTFLSEIIRLMATAEESKSAYVRLADRLAGYYAPVVHVLAGATLFGWLWWTNFDWPVSLLHAIAVLIITCPCALGLAVPAVQVVASGVLFRNGVMIKDGSALERMADIDTVIFDKTGTLTMGEPKLSENGPVSIEAMAVAAGLAAGSAHPLSRAIVKAVEERGIEPEDVSGIVEHPGRGLSGTWRGRSVRLGSLDWCGVRDEKALSSDMPQLALAVEGRQPVVFSFTDTLRPDAAETIRRLKAAGLRVEMISGDREGPVRAVAEELGLDGWKAAWSPQQKLAYVEGLAEAGRKVLMVGDGINDAPALAAGYASMAPSTASDIGRTAADMVFVGASLRAVWLAREVSVRARRLMTQNFAWAITYNVFAVPVAMAGLASPLFAAVAMSASSIIVVANSLRLGLMDRNLDRNFALTTYEGETARRKVGRKAA